MEPTGLQDLEGFKNLQGLSFNLPCLQGYHIAANGNTIITCVEGLGNKPEKEMRMMESWIVEQTWQRRQTCQC